MSHVQSFDLAKEYFHKTLNLLVEVI